MDGYKFVAGPFPDCQCPSHIESGDYPASEFESGSASELPPFAWAEFLKSEESFTSGPEVKLPNA